jgi:hypothetical protein
MPGVMIGSTPVSWERVSRASGIVAASLAIIGIIISGTTYPGVGASAQDITSYYDSNHNRLMLTFLVLSSSVMFFFWFLGAIVSALREAGMGGWAATSAAFGAVRAAFLFAHIAIVGGLAYRIAENGNSDVVLAFQDLQWAIRVTSLFPIAGLVFATAVGFWRARLVPAWFGWAFMVGGFVVFLGGTTFAHSGFWAPDGAFGFFAIAVALAWMFTMSGLLLRLEPTTERAPGRAATSPVQ